MSSLNIGGDKSDMSYRYKMPPMTIKVEGTGNGIKTVLTNIVDVSKALHVIPQYPIKFFAIELGTQSAYDASIERAVINGKHTAADLQKILEKFISIFVLCPTCKLPELKMAVSKKSQRIKIDCAACGHNGSLNTAHRLGSYIITHPPPKVAPGPHKGTEDVEAASKLEADETKAFRAAAKLEKEADVEWFTDTSEEAVRARKVAEFSESAEEVARNAALTNIMNMAKAAGMTDAPSTMLRLYIASKDRTIDEVCSELRRLQIARGLDEPQKVKIIIETYIDPMEFKTVHEQFEKNAKLFSRFTTTLADSLQFITCIEDFVGEVHSHLLPRFPLILKALYDTDVLSEEALNEWYDTPLEANWLVRKEIAAATRQKAEAFMEWLRADEEDDEDEDEE